MTKTARAGLLVNYVPTTKQKEKWNGAETVPAMIVKAWATDMVNLRVFPDAPVAPSEEYITSVEFSGLKKERSWHFIEMEKD